MDAVFSELTVVELRKILKSRGLSEYYKVKPDLVQRLIASVNEGETIESILKLLEKKENDGEKSSEGSNDEFEDSQSEEMSTNFVFKDVEDALEKFSGECERNIETWIKNFEDIATTCKWNNIQKYLYTRKLLTGAARKAIEADDTTVNYDLLTEKLKNEFEEKLTVIEIHEKLSKRKKMLFETLLEYFYEMQKIGKSKMDEKSMVQYIVNGIPDNASGKAILYDATSLEILKTKLKTKTYETIKKQSDANPSQVKKKLFDKKSSDQSQSTSDGTSSGMSSKSNGKRCYNCGSRSHQGQLCPDKSKGTRCFNCNKFRHIAKECKEVKQDASTNQPKPVPLISAIPKADDAHLYAQCGSYFLWSIREAGSR